MAIVHIYAQTIHRTTQTKKYIEQHINDAKQYIEQHSSPIRKNAEKYEILAVTKGMFKIETIRISLNKNKHVFVQAIYYPVV